MSVVTYTLSSGNMMAVYYDITAGQAAITAVLLGLLIMEIIGLVRRYTHA